MQYFIRSYIGIFTDKFEINWKIYDDKRPLE